MSRTIRRTKTRSKKLLINRYIIIKDSDHFDEFFILPKDTNSPWFSYGGAFSLELTQFASKFQATKNQFKDFIDSRNFNEVTREDDNSLPNINFIDHFDLDNKKIVLDENNINILERLTNTKYKPTRYKPTRYIYDKITSKIKADNIDSNIAQKILNIAISKNNIELLKTAVDKGANIDSNIAQKILNIAISKNNTELLKTAADKGANIDVKTEYGKTPLHWTIYINKTEIAHFLIEKGANLDIKDKYGQTPLHWTISENNTGIALALINKGANLNIQDNYGDTALYRATYKNNPEIALALINKGANLDIQNKTGESPLHLAIQKGNTEIALALINKGANLDIQDKTGKSPLHWAIYENNTEIALALINKGANLDIQEGWLVTRNPLHAAIISNRAEIVIALIEKGANVNSKNIFGETPLDLACKSNNEEIMKALIEKGAKGNNMNKVALLVTSIISIIATISLLITAILLPPLSIILFGCAGATGLSSIILLDSYFKSPAYIEIKAPSLQSLNQNEIQKGRMTTLNGEKNKNNPELSSSHNNNPHQ
jgi:ankyrin repeat protein